jgi:hypothetical protein
MFLRGNVGAVICGRVGCHYGCWGFRACRGMCGIAAESCVGVLMPPPQVELVAHVAPAAWGLPSWHAASLQLVLYLEMAQAPYRLQSFPYHYSPSTGSLPALQAHNKIIAHENILEFLKKVVVSRVHSC